MKSWEYTILNIRKMSLDEQTTRFNELGLQGWELEVVVRQRTAYFKRQKQ